MKDKIKSSGFFELNVWEKRGDFFFQQEHFEEYNLVVNNGLTMIAYRISDSSDTTSYIYRMGFGTNGDTPYPADTALTNPYINEFVSNDINNPNTPITYPTFNSVSFSFQLGLQEMNGYTIREYGLICKDGSLFAHKIKGTEVVKTDKVYLTGLWTLTFSAS